MKHNACIIIKWREIISFLKINDAFISGTINCTKLRRWFNESDINICTDWAESKSRKIISDISTGNINKYYFAELPDNIRESCRASKHIHILYADANDFIRRFKNKDLYLYKMFDTICPIWHPYIRVPSINKLNTYTLHDESNTNAITVLTNAGKEAFTEALSRVSIDPYTDLPCTHDLIMDLEDHNFFCIEQKADCSNIQSTKEIIMIKKITDSALIAGSRLLDQYSATDMTQDPDDFIYQLMHKVYQDYAKSAVNTFPAGIIPVKWADAYLNEIAKDTMARLENLHMIKNNYCLIEYLTYKFKTMMLKSFDDMGMLQGDPNRKTKQKSEKIS